MPHTVDEESIDLLHIVEIDLQIRKRFKQYLEEVIHLTPGKMQSQAMVDATTAIADVIVGRARNVEMFRVIKHRLVTIGRGIPEHYALSGSNLLTEDFSILRHCAAEMNDRC